MMRTRRPARRAFTLVELLVAMAVLVTLASLALLVIPDALDKDRTTDAASLTRQWLMISRARAARDQGNRGVRLVTGSVPGGNTQWVTELQYIEQPPPYQPNKTATQFLDNGAPFVATRDNAPYVVFLYKLDANGNLDQTFNTDPVTGQGRPVCEIRNLTSDDANLILNSAERWLRLPKFGYEARITGVSNGPAPSSAVQPPAVNSIGNNANNLTVTLDRYPTTALGASGVSTTPVGVFVDYAFGVILPAQPVLGEPPLRLPVNICIDLSVSQSGWSGTGDCDVLFTPKGQVAPFGAGASGGQINLWVRDYTKAASPLVVQNAGPPPTYDLTPFQNGGEQQIIALKTSSGAMGVFPVLWPNGNGQYSQITPGVYESPYTLAQQGTSGQ